MNEEESKIERKLAEETPGVGYIRKNLTSCRKPANKPSTSRVRTAIAQVVNTYGTSC
jgi:hypothetical protein